MTPRDEYPTPSETRIVASFEDRKRRIESALGETEAHMARMPPSPVTRRLKLALEVVHRAIESWSAREPTDEQLALVSEQVADALLLARRNAPTVRLRRSG
jgi:hypothetical protein